MSGWDDAQPYYHLSDDVNPDVANTSPLEHARIRREFGRQGYRRWLVWKLDGSPLNYLTDAQVDQLIQAAGWPDFVDQLLDS